MRSGSFFKIIQGGRIGDDLDEKRLAGSQELLKLDDGYMRVCDIIVCFVHV